MNEENFSLINCSYCGMEIVFIPLQSHETMIKICKKRGWTVKNNKLLCPYCSIMFERSPYLLKKMNIPIKRKEKTK